MCESVRFVPAKPWRANSASRLSWPSTWESGGRKAVMPSWLPRGPLDAGGAWYSEGVWNGSVELADRSSLVLTVWWAEEARWA